jgi:hypothetical protein
MMTPALSGIGSAHEIPHPGHDRTIRRPWSGRPAGAGLPDELGAQAVEQSDYLM